MAGFIENSGSGTITALNGTVEAKLSAAASVVFQISGTWSAALVFEASIDGTNYFPIGAALLPSSSLAVTTTLNGSFGIPVGGLANVRVRASTFASGTVSITWNSDSFSNTTYTSNAVNVTRATYSAAVSNLVSAAVATDIFTITGSATKVVRVNKISIDGLATTGGNLTVNLIKRSAANTAGTSTTPTVVPHDSTSAAGTAVVRAYTANPSALGAAVGTLRSNRVFISGGATTASIQDERGFGDLGQGIVLRGTSELLCLNLNGVSVNGPLLNLWVEWTEES